jgi:hypothetical protein
MQHITSTPAGVGSTFAPRYAHAATNPRPASEHDVRRICIAAH